MTININPKNLELTPSLRVYIEKKIGSLEKFIHRFDHRSSAEVRITIERTTSHHRKGEVYKASADFHLPKKNLRAEETHENVRAAIDGLKDKLAREIKRYKDKSIR